MKKKIKQGLSYIDRRLNDQGARLTEQNNSIRLLMEAINRLEIRCAALASAIAIRDSACGTGCQMGKNCPAGDRCSYPKGNA